MRLHRFLESDLEALTSCCEQSPSGFAQELYEPDRGQVLRFQVAVAGRLPSLLWLLPSFPDRTELLLVVTIPHSVNFLFVVYHQKDQKWLLVVCSGVARAATLDAKQ